MICLKQPRQFWGGCLLVLLGFFFLGCGEAWRISAQSTLDSHQLARLNVSEDKKLKVAVLPFSSSESTATGDHLTELVVAELVSIPHFELVDPQELMQRLKDKVPNPTVPEDVAEALVIGREVGIEALVLGHITAYRGRVEVSGSENFGLMLRIFDTHTGDLVWSANHMLNAVPVEKPAKMDSLVMYTVKQGITDLRTQLSAVADRRAEASSETALTPAEIKINEPASDDNFVEVPSTQENAPLPVSLKAVQAALSKLGYSPGPVDGIYGRQTRQAILDFQRRNNLTPDGAVSMFLLDSLNNALLKQTQVTQK